MKSLLLEVMGNLKELIVRGDEKVSQIWILSFLPFFSFSPPIIEEDEGPFYSLQILSTVQHEPVLDQFL